MSGTRIVLCGGARPHDPEGVERALRLDLAEPNANVLLALGGVTDAVARSLPSVLLDLMELAAYVFAADQSLGRGRSRATGRPARRRLRFHVPVRCSDLWSAAEVTSALSHVLGLLTDEEYEFAFTELDRPQLFQRYVHEPAPQMEAEEVLVFTGDLDSFGAAVESAIGDGRKLALVSHRTAPDPTSHIQDLAAALADRAPQAVRHIPVWASKADQIGRGRGRRSRPFLQAALATAVATMLGLDGIRVCENGLASLGTAIASKTGQGGPLPATHPRILHGFARLVSLLLDRPFEVNSPLAWHTKGEIVRLIHDRGCADLIRHTVCCSRPPDRPHTHCGRCPRCVERRFAALAAGLADDHDPAGQYQTEPMTGERVLPESALQRARALASTTTLDFFRSHPDGSRVLPFLRLPPEQAAQRVHDLHRRHGQEIQAALTEGLRRHAAEFLSGSLPDSSVLVHAVPARYGQHEPPHQSPTFRRAGDSWDIWFEDHRTALKDGVGPRYIALLLGNPGCTMHAMDLQIAEAASNGRLESSDCSGRAAADGGLHVHHSPAGSGGHATDALAVRRYRARLKEIEDDLPRAAKTGDPELLLELQEERDRILEHMRAVVDLRGKPRPSADDDERARQSVGKAIARTLDRLRHAHPALARHLGKHLSKGRLYSYDPDPQKKWVTQ